MAQPSLYVRPAPGRKVRMPDRPFPYMQDEPMLVPPTNYWLRRLAAGDVVLVDPEKDAKGKKKEG